MSTSITELRKTLRERHRLAYRDMILDSSERLFFEREFATVKVSDIASAAGVATGTIYTYFRCKDDISIGVLRRRIERFLGRLRGLARLGDPEAELCELIGQSLLWFEENYCGGRTFFEPFLAVEASATAHPMTQLAREGLRQYQDLVADYLTRVASTQAHPSRSSVEEMSWFLLLLLQTALSDWVRTERAEPPSARSAALLRLFLDGIRGDRSTAVE